MGEDGRALREPALVSDQAAARLDPSGFDQARGGFVWQQRGASLILMRGAFGMAEIREANDGWRVDGYGHRNYLGTWPGIEGAKAAAIFDALRVFAEAGLVPTTPKEEGA